ncbi:hypothetical protein J2848_001746 [Azospirillum lipoferum]|uniref:Uncharacterized protein n=1 Tax=Azospirillum lipoferum TaxID=193 RepID=A0A5A9GW47_AZOLI|nr:MULTISPECIES: hypothetical protein [Azospirillum]KAA0597774.1 hypothetical protein FZ942_01385 [Azospirillum lipoferum]MCP1610087.1 hypothetical protein [Azospirillum lipoferum]MDW5534420.1 hypothetical protein [Azospirillum sp. NL1]
MIAAKVAQLNGAKLAPGAPSAAAWRVRRLEQEARRLAAEIQARPVAGAADMLVRLDIIATMWGPDGTIDEPGAPLAEVLALLDEIARGALGFQPTEALPPVLANRGTGAAGTQDLSVIGLG